jgi:pyruvate dehydrogenase phosphatase
MTNDKCNAGSCCLVTILIQKSMYKVQGGKYIRYSSEAPCLYTSHLGDCRAILLKHPRDDDDDCSDGEEDDDIENHEALLDSFSDDDDSDDTEEQDADMSSCSSNESHDSFFQDEQRVDNTRSHRMIPFKKRLLPVNRSIVIPRSIVPSVCLQSVTLTRDHTPYNHAEAMLVRQRCKSAPNAIAPAISGGIKRVAGSLSVTRALGDAYLKCKRVSFAPFKDHAPYITACPEIRMREIDDRAMFLVLGTDGVWEKVDGAKIAKWVSKFFDKLTEEDKADTLDGEDCQSIANASVGSTRKRRRDPFSPLSAHSIASRTNSLTKSKISDVIAWKILNKVRRTRKMKSLKSLMAFPPGRARRLRHDDITACVVDLSGFIDFVDYQT